MDSFPLSNADGVYAVCSEIINRFMVYLRNISFRLGRTFCLISLQPWSTSQERLVILQLITHYNGVLHSMYIFTKIIILNLPLENARNNNLQ